MSEMEPVTYAKGIDIFYSDASGPPVEDSRCLACQSPMKTEQKEASRSMAEAMSGSTTDSYVYFCPHSAKEEHRRLVELYREWEHLVSRRLKAIVTQELMEMRNEFRNSL